MHDHGESGGASQQMDKGDQTLAFARHDPTTRPPTGDATTQQVRAWTAMALGRQPLLHPWPHTAPPPGSDPHHLTCTKKNSESQAH